MPEQCSFGCYIEGFSTISQFLLVVFFYVAIIYPCMLRAARGDQEEAQRKHMIERHLDRLIGNMDIFKEDDEGEEGDNEDEGEESGDEGESEGDDSDDEGSDGEETDGEDESDNEDGDGNEEGDDENPFEDEEQEDDNEESKEENKENKPVKRTGLMNRFFG